MMEKPNLILELIIYGALFVLIKIILNTIALVILRNKRKKFLKNIGDDLEFEDEVPDL